MKKTICVMIFAMLMTSCERVTTNEPVDDGIPPNAPVGIEIYYASDGEIGIQWVKNSEPGIEGYSIFRTVNDSTKLDLINFTNAQYYFDSGLNYDSVYFYSIKAKDIYGRESMFSEYVAAVPRNRYKPYPPSHVTINALNWYDTLSINLTWLPPSDTDIDGYQIFRNIEDEFDLSNLLPLIYTKDNWVKDTNNLQLLTNYYYKVVSVDKGGLKSGGTITVNDMIFDRPKLVFPDNDTTIKAPIIFKIISISTPAEYKLVIQRNEQFDAVFQKIFSISEIKSNIAIPIEWYSYEPYRKYYWRVISSSPGKNVPNSFSNLGTFTIIP